jgi:zinc/manganese transport system permease protein
LPDDEIRRIASYQQSFNEMTRGEQFVQDVLRTKARSRERWMIGLPAAIVAITALGLLSRRLHLRPWRSPG